MIKLEQQYITCLLRSGNTMIIERNFSIFNDENELLRVSIYDENTGTVSKEKNDYLEAQIIAEQFSKELRDSQFLGQMLKLHNGVPSELTGYTVDLNNRKLHVLHGVELDRYKAICNNIAKEIQQSYDDTDT